MSLSLSRVVICLDRQGCIHLNWCDRRTGHGGYAVRREVGAVGKGGGAAGPGGRSGGLGASRFYIFRHIIFPTALPALLSLSGFAIALARGAGEFGSVVFISGNLPMKTEITPLLIWMKLEQFDYDGAAALGMITLMIALLMLFAIDSLQGWGQRRLAPGTKA